MTNDRLTAIQEAIDEAWATTDPATKQAQFDLTGSLEVPTPETLIYHIVRKILEKS